MCGRRLVRDRAAEEAARGEAVLLVRGVVGGGVGAGVGVLLLAARMTENRAEWRNILLAWVDADRIKTKAGWWKKGLEEIPKKNEEPMCRRRDMSAC